MNVVEDQFLFVEKYRPQTIKDVILPVKYKKIFTEIVNSGDHQHLLLSGGAGIGKTTIAKALCNELNSDVLIINASENGNIDMLRTTIRNFASSVSFTGNKKVVILDEADYLNAQSTQPALRNFMEEFSKNCRFILTCNYVNRIIEPLRSRCSVIEFNLSKDEKLAVAKAFLKRTEEILKNENIEYDRHVIGNIIKQHNPDFRKILNEIQSNVIDGKLDQKLTNTLSSTDIEDLTNWLKTKEFGKLREWVALNNDISLVELNHLIYNKLDVMLKPQSIPEAIMIMNEYQYKVGFVADQEINTIAFFTELMMSVEFK